MKTLKLLAILFIAPFLVTNCSDDDDMTPINTPTPTATTIVDLAIDTPELSSLVAALQQADGDLTTVLSGDGPFTVLAPTNAAFATFLSANGFASLDEVPTDILSKILLNHVISGNVMSTDLVALGEGYTSTSTNGAGGMPMSLYFNTSNGVMFNGISSVEQADIEASNGTIHIVDAVIGLPNLVDHALANPNFTNLVGALSAADGDLVDVVGNNGPFTILAPGNNAFGTFLTNNGFASLDEVPTDILAQVLLNHVLSGSISSSNLVEAGAGYTTTSATAAPDGNALSLYFNTSDGVSFNGVSNVATPDIVATNGIIHAVDGVIGLPTVVDFALADPNFTTLVSALTRDDLTFDYVGALSTPNGTAPAPFTVFAPTNDAFASLLEELGISGLNDISEPVLKATLDHHAVAQANVLSSDLMDGMTISTLGGNITAQLEGGAALVDANGRICHIIAVDVQASNGVIHVLDKVVLPPL